MIPQPKSPGQEEGKARLVRKLRVGAVAKKGREVRDLVEETFAHRSRQWQEWRDNLEEVSQPDAAIRIAELVLDEAGQGNHRPAPPKVSELLNFTVAISQLDEYFDILEQERRRAWRKYKIEALRLPGQ